MAVSDDFRHLHDWQPVISWSGRYRCDSCGVLGYRGVTQPNVHTDYKPAEIFPYICKKKGCTRGAMVVGKRQVCSEHFRRRR